MSSSYQARPFNKLSDYPVLMGFWKAHKWSPPPASDLPPTGIVVEDVATGTLLAAGFLYKTDSSFAWLEFIVGNPKADRVPRRLAVDLVIADLSQKAKEMGFKYIYSNLKHKGLIRRYKNHGFLETDTEMSSLLKRI